MTPQHLVEHLPVRSAGTIGRGSSAVAIVWSDGGLSSLRLIGVGSLEWHGRLQAQRLVASWYRQIEGRVQYGADGWEP